MVNDVVEVGTSLTGSPVAPSDRPSPRQISETRLDFSLSLRDDDSQSVGCVTDVLSTSLVPVRSLETALFFLV